MGDQNHFYFPVEGDVKYPPNDAVVVTPGYHMSGGGIPLDRLSNTSSDSQLSYSSENCLSPPSHADNMSNSSLYGNNSLPPQQYDSSLNYPYYPGAETRHTPSSLGWPRGTELVKLYKFIVSKGKLPYFQLLERFTPTYETPQKVYLDELTPGLYKKGQFPCQYPGICNGKVSVFGRPADLERHYKNVHADEKDSFRCDYRKCSRSKVENAFTRKDHYRDHLRDYHKEDIGCAKGEKSSREKDKIKWQKAQRLWLAERNISCTYWRCVRCLIKNYVDQQGWECASCKSPCEEDRVRNRQNLGPGIQTPEDRSEATMVDGAQYAAPYCATCHGTSYVDYGYGPTPCSDCDPAAGYSYQPIVYQQ